MKTIRFIPAALLAAAGLMPALPAQEFKEIPVQPDPVEEPMDMEELLRKELQRGDDVPPEVLRHHAENPDDLETLRQMIQEHARRDMLLAEPGKADGGKPAWIIGVSVEPLPPFVRDHLGLGEKAGTRVSMVAGGSPAARAGLRMNDIILTANGEDISTLEQLKAAVAHSGKEGSTLVLEILRRGEKRAVSIRPPQETAREEKNTGEEARPEVPVERRLVQLQRRLSRQEREIGKLKEEVSRLKRALEEEPDDE